MDDASMSLTYSNHLLPIGMVHVCIQNLLAMCQGHAPDTPRYVIEGCPQCLYDFTINLLCSRNVAWGKAGQAGILVPMNVKESYASAELQSVRDGKSGTVFHSLLEVDSILAHNVIHDQCKGHVFHVIGKSLAKAIVHVYLPCESGEDHLHV